MCLSGIISVPCENAVLYTGFAFLACTTVFYDAHRARGDDFIDYPQHYQFFDRNEEGLDTTTGRRRLDNGVMGLVGHLDVWPENKLVAMPGSVTGMIKTIFDHNIHRLFWPYGLKPQVSESKLPWYARMMLRTRLKAVY